MDNPFEHIGTSQDELITNFIQGAFIIDFGFIRKVINIDYVSVQVGASNSSAKVQVFPCIMGSLCSNNMTVKVDPKVGDKVIVFYPRTYHQDMFLPETDGTVFDTGAVGYSFGNGIAFLANQFFTNAYADNYMHVTEKQVDIKITKEGNETKDPVSLNINGATFVIDKDGIINITSNNKNIVIDAGTGNVNIKGTKVTVNDTSLEVS